MQPDCVAQRDFVRKHPDAVNGVLRALVRAEKFAAEHACEAAVLVAAALKIDNAVMQERWHDFQYLVKLDKALLITLEDETRWALKRRLTQRAEMPNYRSFIYADGLKAVKPGGVSIDR